MHTYYVSMHICVRSPRGKALPLQTVMPYMRKEKPWRFIIAQLKLLAGGKGRSAVACAAYRSGTKLTDLATGKIFDYSNKSGVVFSEVLLPENAPTIFAVDRNILWDAVERKETHSAAQLAREVEVALPCEFTRQEQIDTVREYIMKNFVREGMCADWALHDKGDGNPHAHIMLTMRAIKPNGRWAEKSRTIYKLDPNGQKIPVIDPTTGQQKIGARGRKMWQRETVPANDWNDHSKAEKMACSMGSRV